MWLLLQHHREQSRLSFWKPNLSVCVLEQSVYLKMFDCHEMKLFPNQAVGLSDNTILQNQKRQRVHHTPRKTPVQPSLLFMCKQIIVYDINWDTFSR